MKRNATLLRKILMILILILFVICIIITCYQYFSPFYGSYAYIYQDGNLLDVVDLSQTDKPYEITVDYKGKESEGYNIIRVENGKIGIKDADCPDKTCVHMGMTSSKNFPITCLPHKLIIQIKGEDTSTSNLKVDAISQ